MTTKLISREPTEEMLEAGEDMASGRSGKVPVYPEDIFGAMFDAAPAINPWVSVKERLPENPDIKYLCVPSDKALIGTYSLSWLKTWADDPTLFWWDESIMPIPRPEE